MVGCTLQWVGLGHVAGEIADGLAGDHAAECLRLAVAGANGLMLVWRLEWKRSSCMHSRYSFF
jgi:hypothetical protein